MISGSRYKITVIAPVFFPLYGGMEQVAGMLAHHWSVEHDVTIVTDTPAGNDVEAYPYRVLRSPAKLELLKLLKASDIIVAHGLSLKYVPFMLPFRHQSFMVHHIYYQRNIQGEQNWKDRLKLFAARFFHSISVSWAVADRLTVPSEVIHNPYNDDVYFRDETPKVKDIVFAGRLVSEKGCMVLLRALNILQEKGIRFTGTIIGSGNEHDDLKNFAKQHGFDDMVTFTGAFDRIRLAEELRKHRIMVVPSIGDESFGLVVLEGLACGCRLIVSDKGGIPEASGGFGRLFQAGNDTQLAGILEEELNGKPKPEPVSLKNFLDAHSAEHVAKAYIRYFESSL